jgi:hypothetical protein
LLLTCVAGDLTEIRGAGSNVRALEITADHDTGP